MDSSNVIGGPTWNPPISSLRSPDGDRLPLLVPAEQSPMASLPGDRLDLHGTSDKALEPVRMPSLPPGHHAAPVEMSPPRPTPFPLTREAVPVNRLAEGISTLFGGQPQVTVSLNGLGVLVQLDDVSLVHRMRAIDDRPRNELFQEFSLVGPSSASRYLAHPEEMYLSI